MKDPDQKPAGDETSTENVSLAASTRTNKPARAKPEAARSTPKHKARTNQAPVPKPSARARKPTKTDQALALLRRPSDCTLAELMKVTKWQQHSVQLTFQTNSE